MIPKFLVTDTHPLLNYFSNKTRKLSKKARQAFDAALSGDLTVYVPVYVAIETSQLQKRGKCELSKPLQNWFSDLFSSKAFILAPLDMAIVMRYHEMTFTNDPADALIVATAIRLELPLITNDSQIHAAKPCLLYWD